MQIMTRCPRYVIYLSNTKNQLSASRHPFNYHYVIIFIIIIILIEWCSYDGFFILTGGARNWIRMHMYNVYRLHRYHIYTSYDICGCPGLVFFPFGAFQQITSSKNVYFLEIPRAKRKCSYFSSSALSYSRIFFLSVFIPHLDYAYAMIYILVILHGISDENKLCLWNGE